MTDIVNDNEMLGAENTEAPRPAGLRGRVSDARESTSAALAEARARASGYYASSRQRAAAGIDSNPLALLIGGAALGVLVGALLPRTEREAELLGDTGRKINDTAQGAFRAAKDAGQTKLGEIGITADTARDPLGALMKAVTTILTEAGEAAAHSVKSGPQAAESDGLAKDGPTA